MIPMFRVLARGNSRMVGASAIRFSSRWLRTPYRSIGRPNLTQGGHPGGHRASGASFPAVSLLLVANCGSLPPVVGERLVGLGHLVHVFPALYRIADTVGSIEQFPRKPTGHGLLPALPAVADQPADGQRGGPAGPDLDRHLVGGTADPAALHLELRLGVLDRSFQGGDRLGPAPVLYDVERVVHDALGQA